MNFFNLTFSQTILVVISALLLGFSKTGISGMSMPVIPILAAVFGGKESTGVILPMLIVGDIIAIIYYNRHGNFKDIKKLLPWTMLGLILGIIVGSYINDRQFKMFIAIAVFICLAILIYTEKKGEDIKLPKGIWFYALVGIGAGFTSMIGNAAGPLLSVYLLVKGFKKINFIGTNAWFFFILNLLKLPLQIFFWHNITMNTAIITFKLIPIIALGAFVGIKIVKKLNEKLFRYVIILMTFLAAVRLLF